VVLDLQWQSKGCQEENKEILRWLLNKCLHILGGAIMDLKLQNNKTLL
jgi:hypothetical protein